MTFTGGSHTDSVERHSQKSNGTGQCKQIAQVQRQIMSRMGLGLVHRPAFNQTILS